MQRKRGKKATLQGWRKEERLGTVEYIRRRSYRGVQAVTCVRLGPNWRLAARGLLGIHSDPGRPFARDVRGVTNGPAMAVISSSSPSFLSLSLRLDPSSFFSYPSRLFFLRVAAGRNDSARAEVPVPASGPSSSRRSTFNGSRYSTSYRLAP